MAAALPDRPALALSVLALAEASAGGPPMAGIHSRRPYRTHCRSCHHLPGTCIGPGMPSQPDCSRRSAAHPGWLEFRLHLRNCNVGFELNFFSRNLFSNCWWCTCIETSRQLPKCFHVTRWGFRWTLALVLFVHWPTAQHLRKLVLWTFSLCKFALFPLKSITCNLRTPSLICQTRSKTAPESGLIWCLYSRSS